MIGVRSSGHNTAESRVQVRKATVGDPELSPLIFGYFSLRELTVPSKIYLF